MQLGAIAGGVLQPAGEERDELSDRVALEDADLRACTSALVNRALQVSHGGEPSDDCGAGICLADAMTLSR